jgi:chemotaxis protein MotA
MSFIGIIVVVGAVLGGFVMAGGAPLLLWQPAEFVVILGAALGSLLISTPMKLLKQVMGHAFHAMKGGSISKNQYFELLSMLYEVFQTAKKDGILGLEAHVEEPQGSAIFTKYPGFLKNHEAVSFLTDTLKVIIAGGVPAHELEALMETDLETHHEEGHKAPGVLSKVSDAMPGLGIVAAVLGIVVTMQAIDGPPEEIGHHVGAALVGTFLGVLGAYGFIGPLATGIEHSVANQGRYIACIKAGVVAFAKDVPPLIAVEFARRSIYADVRPSFKELETALRGGKA